ncbi:hydroquinone glucosyltransferase-like [Magnolia sinica]|uniref:hydroquinone glucosyltransferase-like n=1 Tax=Magnolia sinica TaxID=86752 RepID=UPI0026595CD4|nr:hydroquinone glucosyltransferase-like [Magnolia sinica]
MDTTKCHVAIIPSPGVGQIIPLLEFAKRLVSLHGFHVSFFILTTDASTAQSQLIRSTSVPDGLHIIQLRQDSSSMTRISKVIRESIPLLRSAITDLANPTVLIVDIFGTDVFEIADDLRMLKYLFFTSSASLLALMMHLPTLDQEINGEYIDLPEPLQIPGCNPIRIDDLVDSLRDRRNERYRSFLHHAHRFRMAHGILINTCEDLEPKTISTLRENDTLMQNPTPRVYPVGPLIRSDRPFFHGPACLTWLDMHPPESVLFVAFGSGGTLSAKQITELAWGLELSQQRFIWVVRPPSGRDGPRNVRVSMDGSDDPLDYLPDGFLTRTRGVGLVVHTFGPQIEILGHISTAGFLTHCGWNSTMESIMHGVPMIVWPLYAEQRMNAAMLADDLKVAVRSEPLNGVVGREELERVVRLVIDGEEGKTMRARVKKLKDAALRALDEGGSSCNSLSHVVSEWKVNLQNMDENVQ